MRMSFYQMESTTMFTLAPVVIVILVILFGALTFLPLFANPSELDERR